MEEIENQLRNRAAGSLVGLAVGDALGTTIEFSSRDSYQPLTDIVGGGPFNLKAGQWTDDTSMALCLADSLISTASFDFIDQYERYLRWLNEGYFSSTGSCFDVGNQTLEALGRFHRNQILPEGFSDTRQAGNGSLMRLAPIPILFYDQPNRAALMAAASSLPTHVSLLCGQSCAVYARLISQAILGSDKEVLFHIAKEYSLCVDNSELQAILAGSFQRKTRNEIASSGYVLHTLEAALWAFANTDSFTEGALLATNLGDDADTVGAVYGQLAGAYYGLEKIPPHWREILYQGEEIIAMAHRLFDLRGKITIPEQTLKIIESITKDYRF